MKNKVKRGEVYFLDFGPTEGVGSVQGGRRFCVVAQNDVGNKYSSTTFVCPITSSTYKSKLPTHVMIENGLKYPSIILAEQFKTVEQKDLEGPFYRLNEKEMLEFDKALAVSVGIW